ncbi:MAG: site-2 protease family protein, partial [Patescibacteria group bacterium]
AISGTAKDSPAFAANLKEGDVILWAAYGGEELKDPVKVLDFVALIKKAGAGEIDLKIQRGRENLVFSLNGRINPPAGQGSLGLSLAEIGFSKESFFRSLGKGAETAFLTFKLVALGFMNFISKIFVTPKIIETITGPVGIFTLATEAGALGGAYLLNLLALISINLAVLNLIPFPALDGGRFLFLIIEKIKGSPISKKVQIIVNTAGFAAFILLMIVVTVQDLGRIF